MSITNKTPAFMSTWEDQKTCGQTKYLGPILMDNWEKRKGILKEQTENQKALEQDFYQTGVENKDQPNRVMVSLSNKVTAQLC